MTLRNGDRITGEVVRLERGRLEFKTDDAGTLSLEWDKLASLVAARVVEVVTTGGWRFLGTLTPAADKATLAIATPGQTIPLPMIEVTSITPIGRSFWRKLDGSFDAGFSYTQSSGIAQLNLNTETIYRKLAFQGRVGASITLTKEDDDSDRDDRGTLELGIWAVSVDALVPRGGEPVRIEREPRHPPALADRRGRGSTADQQQPRTDGGRRRHRVQRRARRRRAVIGATSKRCSCSRRRITHYDRPKTNLDVKLRYYLRLTEAGRHRLQFDGGVKRELWKDFCGADALQHLRQPPPQSHRRSQRRRRGPVDRLDLLIPWDLDLIPRTWTPPLGY